MLSLKPPQKFISLVGITAIVFGLSVTKLKLALADKIGYLGSIGTYSEQATKVYQSKTPGFEQAVGYKDIAAVATAVKSGEVTRAVIPVENSHSGFVFDTYKVIFKQLDPGFRIIDEVTIPISSSLLVKPGTQARDIKKIISQRNAILGVANYLQKNFPNIPLTNDETSTAAAAKKVSQGDGTTAAVASPSAAKIYGLQALANNIQDEGYKTNFWIIVPSSLAPEKFDSNHFIIALLAPSSSQIFSSTITKLQQAGFNVVNVHSSPLLNGIYSYRYLIRVESKYQVSNATKRVSALLKSVQHSGGRALLIGAYKR